MEMIILEGLKELADLNSAVVPNLHDTYRDLDINKIYPCKNQPRKKFSATAQTELETSIDENGLLQPIIVRPIGSEFEIIAGERRWRACKSLGLATIAAHVLDLSEKQAAVASIIENVQREDLNPVEKAKSYAALVLEHKLTHEQISAVVGKSRSSITNYLRLLDLSAEAIQHLEQGNLEMGHARAILSLTGAEQTTIANIVVAKNLSVRQTELMVRGLLTDDSDKTIARLRDPQQEQLADYKQRLIERFGRGVKITVANNGTTSVTITFDEMQKIEWLLG